ncbi:uncharacterized protein LY89DRAFT_389109 [Mollisia scopiformis]|uniref:N-acetyltransferase domain-containing protein n=1 Tax=Mollisia scopiformis TaxID=149040 RepID=A0A194XPC6_MOLSC|nr:uncharacterized protein LY89DRAFT_389109 [Mollisia scopiformis]KUJ21924.1 hypothetical protein LY89DRAFT_389109 [Mollisia scopiformis]
MTSSVTLLPAEPSDIPTLITISHAAFEQDTHTRFKALYAGYNHGEGMSSPLSSWINDTSKGAVIKAVSPSHEIVGWAAWRYINFQPTDAPPSPPSPTKTQTQEDPFPPPPKPPSNPSVPKIKHLATLTDAAMTHYSSLLTPPGVRCLILMGINVAPSHQSHGVGSSLIRWGTRLADEQRVYTWVSSSHDGYRAFEKCGFREVGRLELSLDDFVEDEGVGEEKWGEYVWRYMRRGVGGV